MNLIMDAYYAKFNEFIAMKEPLWLDPDAENPKEKEEDMSEEYSDYLDGRDEFLEI